MHSRRGPSWIVLTVLLALASCHNEPPAEVPEVPPGPPIPEGDGVTSPLGKMCAHLRDVRCSDGQSVTANGKTRTCYQAMTAAQNNAPIPIDCVIDAKDLAAVRKCGDPAKQITIRCLHSE